MPVGLAGAAVFAGVEEGEEAGGAGAGAGAGFGCVWAWVWGWVGGFGPGAEAFVCCFKVGGFEEVCLGFPGFCGEDEVIGDYGEFVQDKGVGWN